MMNLRADEPLNKNTTTTTDEKEPQPNLATTIEQLTQRLALADNGFQTQQTLIQQLTDRLAAVSNSMSGAAGGGPVTSTAWLLVEQSMTLRLFLRAFIGDRPTSAMTGQPPHNYAHFVPGTPVDHTLFVALLDHFVVHVRGNAPYQHGGYASPQALQILAAHLRLRGFEYQEAHRHWKIDKERLAPTLL
jgi:hypothetical protein